MDELVRSDVLVRCQDGVDLPAYFVRPDVSDPVPGIVFMYEAFGMNDEMKGLADVFAARGYAVLLPDLLARGFWVGCLVSLFADLRRGSGRGVDDLVAARAFLAAHPTVDGPRIGIMGLCLGGGFALLLGKTGLFKVAAPFYGDVPADLSGSCPVVASFGARDRPFARQAPHLCSELERIGVPMDVKVYEGAGHSFMNRPPNRVIGGLMRMAGAGFQPEAAADATDRVAAFLAAHL